MQSQRRSLRLAAAAAVSILGCTTQGLLNLDNDCSADGDGSPGIQGSLVLTSSLAATYTPGAEIEVQATLQNASGGELCSRFVTWTPGPGGGTVTPSRRPSGDNGQAGTIWTLPNVVGTSVTLTGEVESSIPLIRVVVTASLAPAAPTRIAPNPGNFPDQTAPMGQPVAMPPSVKVTDQVGAPHTGVAVTFKTVGTSGSLAVGADVDELIVSTGPDGVATVPVWVVDRGPNQINASIPGADRVAFHADGVALYSISILAGDMQSAPVNSPLAVQPAIVIRDAQGTGIPDIEIQWVVVINLPSYGTLVPEFALTASTNRTDGSGVARLASFIPTAPGAGQFRAITRDRRVAPERVEFNFTGSTSTAPTPLTIAIHSGSNQPAVLGSAVGTPPAVIVRNGSAQPVQGVAVSWMVVLGSGIFEAPVTTNAEGISRLVNFTPTSIGTVTLRAFIPGTAQFVDFPFTVAPPSSAPPPGMPAP